MEYKWPELIRECLSPLPYHIAYTYTYLFIHICVVDKARLLSRINEWIFHSFNKCLSAFVRMCRAEKSQIMNTWVVWLKWEWEREREWEKGTWKRWGGSLQVYFVWIWQTELVQLLLFLWHSINCVKNKFSTSGKYGLVCVLCYTFQKTLK